MKSLFFLFLAILTIALLTQWGRGFLPSALRSAIDARLTALFHAPAGFINAFQPGALYLANVKEIAPGIKVRTRTPAQQARFLAQIYAAENLRLDPQDNGNPTPGIIHAANETRFNETFYVQALTDYTVGWRDPNNIEATVDFFAPPVEVQRRFEYKEAINAEEFYSDGSNDDLRALGSNFPIIPPYQGVDTLAKTLNRGLTLRVDRDTMTGANWEQKAVAKIMRRLLRNKLRRAITLLSAAATNTAKTWDTTAGKDPDNDVLAELVVATTASGIRPTRIGYGDTAWSKRVLAHRAQNNAGGYASAGQTVDQVASFLGIDKALISRERYQSAAAAKTEIVNNLVLMFMAMDAADTEDPSNIKGFYSLCENGQKFGVYVQQISAKLWDVTVEHYELTKITSTLGIRKFTVS